MDQVHQNPKTDSRHNLSEALFHMQQQWPALGKELFVLEHAFSGTSTTDQQSQAEQESIRKSAIARLYQNEGQYSRATRYLAFLLVKLGRGGEIVGNPYRVEKGSKKQLLPYTGLEGYYAGSEKTSQHAGMAPDEILQEEAHRGNELLKMVKKHAVEHDCWIEFTRLQRVLDKKEQENETIKAIQMLWEMVVSRLRTRVYHNPEFELTMSEKIEALEQMLNTREKGQLLAELQAEHDKLKQEYERKSAAEREKERNERERIEKIRDERIEEFQHFREETYQILRTSGQGHYDIGIQDGSWEQASILETIVLPKIPARETYPPVQVKFTSEQLEGYLFLSKLGEIGDDPLARSDLISDEHF